MAFCYFMLLGETLKWAGVNPTNQHKPINKPFYESLKTLVPTNVPIKINLCHFLRVGKLNPDTQLLGLYGS